MLHFRLHLAILYEHMVYKNDFLERFSFLEKTVIIFRKMWSPSAVRTLADGLNSTGEGISDLAQGVVIGSSNLAKGFEYHGSVATDKFKQAVIYGIGFFAIYAAARSYFEYRQHCETLKLERERLVSDRESEQLYRDHEERMMDIRIKNSEAFQKQETVHMVGQPSSSSKPISHQPRSKRSSVDQNGHQLFNDIST